MRTNQLEGLSGAILSEHGVETPVNAFRLARECGLSLRPVSAYEEGFLGGEIRFNGRAPARQQHETVIRMLARYLLDQHGFYPTDAATSHLARALMLPLDVFVDDLELAPKKGAFEWLMERHPYASGTLIGARAGDIYAAQSRRARQSRRLVTA